MLDVASAAAEPLAVMEAYAIHSAAAMDWAHFLALCRALRAPTSDWPAEMELVTRWYEPHLARIYEDAPVRLCDVRQLLQIAATYPTRERFLTDVTLDPPDATSDHAGAPSRDDDYLILSTIHSAKGQEWKAVYILNVVDGCIPSDMGTGTTQEIEEERRLLYVAMTRAKEELQLMVPQRFYVHQQRAHGDRHVYASRSRFIPDALEQRFEPCAWPEATAAETTAQRGLEPIPAIDVAASIRSLWR